jgi:hypothetical protein
MLEISDGLEARKSLADSDAYRLGLPEEHTLGIAFGHKVRNFE